MVLLDAAVGAAVALRFRLAVFSKVDDLVHLAAQVSVVASMFCVA